MEGKKQKNDETTEWHGRKKKVCTETETKTHTHTPSDADTHTSATLCRIVWWRVHSLGQTLTHQRSMTPYECRSDRVCERERGGRTQRYNRHTKRNNSAGEATRAYAIKKGKENDEEPNTTCTDVLVVRRSSLQTLHAIHSHRHSAYASSSICRGPWVRYSHTHTHTQIQSLAQTKRKHSISLAGGRPRPWSHQQQ